MLLVKKVVVEQSIDSVDSLQFYIRTSIKRNPVFPTAKATPLLAATVIGSNPEVSDVEAVAARERLLVLRGYIDDLLASPLFAEEDNGFSA